MFNALINLTFTSQPIDLVPAKITCLTQLSIQSQSEIPLCNVGHLFIGKNCPSNVFMAAIGVMCEGKDTNVLTVWKQEWEYFLEKLDIQFFCWIMIHYSMK